MKLVVWVKLLPTPIQAAALEANVTARNEAATWAPQVAFEQIARHPLELRKHAYLPIREQSGAQGVRGAGVDHGEPDGVQGDGQGWPVRIEAGGRSGFRVGLATGW
ncbi:hypothetical protein [Streptomyces mirabilis]|uniref:hypothetical protein n=1 Tax=Streptomyces mirabilis TaxID=68239 RepID=UPI0033E92FC5